MPFNDECKHAKYRKNKKKVIIFIMFSIVEMPKRKVTMYLDSTLYKTYKNTLKKKYILFENTEKIYIV